MRKPRITINCVANRYAAHGERICEFSDGKGNGGLISLITREDGTLSVDVYRHGPKVEVRIGKPEKPRG